MKILFYIYILFQLFLLIWYHLTDHHGISAADCVCEYTDSMINYGHLHFGFQVSDKNYYNMKFKIGVCIIHMQCPSQIVTFNINTSLH